jgi:hypothetical protein
MSADNRPCPCGSGKPSWWAHDGNGIPLFRTCVDCKKAKLNRINPRVLRPYSQADVDEPIEEAY